MDIEEITENIYLVRGENRGKFPFSHSILIKDDVCALIDTGCGLEQLEKIRSIPLDMVLNSHSHIDHTSGNWYFPQVPLVVPEQEYEYNSNLFSLSQRYVSRELSPVWMKFVTNATIFKDAIPTRSYGDREVFDFGSTRLEAIHTPGHCTGHHCFFERSQKILLSFDIDLTRFGPWYGHEESDIDQFLASIEKVRELHPEIILSSHRGAVRGDVDNDLVTFGKILEQRDEKILSFLSREKSLKEIVDKALIYGKFPYWPQLLQYWEKVMICKHLHRLMKKGSVVPTKRGYRRER
jgi:glyoxylase-like metal-dependent hydrolase (beta-lactamase superfamily II)